MITETTPGLLDVEDVKKMNVYQRMHYAAGLIEHRLRKDNTNTFQKYKYVSHDDVVEAARAPLIAARLAVTLSAHDCQITSSEETKKSGEKSRSILAEGVLTMTVINIDTPGDRYTVEVPAYALDNSDKAYGKLLSYGKKYGLMAMCGLLMATGEDTDKDRLPAPSAIPQKKKALTKVEMLKEITSIALRWEATGEDLKKHIQAKGLATSADMNIKHVESWYRKMQERDTAMCNFVECVQREDALVWMARRGGILGVDPAAITDAIEAVSRDGMDGATPAEDIWAECVQAVEYIGGTAEEASAWMESEGLGTSAADYGILLDEINTRTKAFLPLIDAAGGLSKWKKTLKCGVMELPLEGDDHAS